MSDYFDEDRHGRVLTVAQMRIIAARKADKKRRTNTPLKPKRTAPGPPLWQTALEVIEDSNAYGDEMLEALDAADPQFELVLAEEIYTAWVLNSFVPAYADYRPTPELAQRVYELTGRRFGS